MKQKILFFSPFQVIWQQAFPERYLSEILKSGDHDVFALGCDGILNTYCSGMEAFGKNFGESRKSKEEICRACRKNRQETWNGDTMFLLENFITKDQRINARTIAIQYTKNPSFDFKFDDIEIAKIAAYETILRHKISTLDNLSDQLISEIAAAIENCILIASAMQNLFAQHSFSKVVIYNLNYGTSQIAGIFAKKHDAIPLHFHHAFEFGRWGEMFFLNENSPQFALQSRIQDFNERRSTLKFQYNQIERVFHHIRTLWKANMPWVYSAAKSPNLGTIESLLNIKKDDSIALLSLSSLDEFVAVETCVTNGSLMKDSHFLFGSQINWLSNVINFFAEHPEWILIIRIHPREFPNKREKTLSESAKVYRDLLVNLPSNIRLNFPDQKISIYDLFDYIKLHLTSWSSVGLESALFGIPTSAICRGLSLYSTSYVNFVPINESDFYKYLSTILSAPISRKFEIYKKARDWLLFDFAHSSVGFINQTWMIPKTGLIYKVLRKIRLISPYRRKFHKYLRKTQISEIDRAAILEFFETLEPIYLIKNRLFSKSNEPIAELEKLKKLGHSFGHLQ